ncbi:MAG: methyl-accepting chemotaxis protein [Rubrivivax sp.]|nr:MAG: methyl-accepting chemotaxis protein [Rubrivivax sp.]
MNTASLSQPRLLSRLSLNAKLCLSASVCAVISLLVTGVATGVRSSQVAEENATQNARADGLAAAQGVQAQLDATFQVVQTLASTLEVGKGADTPMARTQLDATLKQVLAQHGHWLAFYSGWEPNALDGQDADHVSKGPQDDATGRFMSYWNRASGSIAVEPLVDYEKAGANDWYDIPRRTGKDALVEPYLYKVSGKEVLITSLVSPVMVNGKFVGIVGVDFLLAGLQDQLAKVHSVEGAKVALISAAGVYVSHPDPAKVGKPAGDLSDKALASIKAGEAHEYVDAAGQVRVLTPVRAGRDTAAWSLCIEYSQAAAQAPARAMMRLTALIAIGCSIVATIALSLTVTALMRPVGRLAVTMESLASGQSNLRVDLPVNGHDELARISDAFNRFMAKLRGAFEEVKETSGGVDVAAQEISSGNTDLSARTEHQASNLEEVAASMVQLSQGVRNSAQTAQQAEALTRQAGETARRSESVMSQAMTAMEGVSTSSKRIADITTVIDGIAFQTNILALNAAVEAARAGEQGRGFAVVANEVRTLAQRAATAAKDIKGLIDESVVRVERGTGLIRDTSAAVTQLVSAVDEVTGLVTSISHSSHEQASGIAHVEVAISQLDEMTQQNAALVEEAAAAAGALTQQTQRLSSTMLQFV